MQSGRKKKMTNLSPDEVWASFCKEWEEARQHTMKVYKKAFVKGWLQTEHVEELSTAHNAEDSIRKKMDKFLESHGKK
jgi:hypothetical protein